MSLSDPEGMAGDCRGATRTSMYVGAVLSCQAGAVPVRIRNMSTTGALVESPLRPRPGESVRLVRGALKTDALVIWSDDSRSGLKFEKIVEVPRWLELPQNAEQQRVDALVGLVRSGAASATCAAGEPQCLTRPAAGKAGDLCGIILNLRCVAEELGQDPRLVEVHATRLQALDIGLEALSAIAQELAAGRADGRAAGTKMP